MTTLSTDTPREYQLGDQEEYPVIASDIIYEGAAVGENASGYARPLQADDPFLGFALGKADNSTGSAGDETVKVRTKGRVKLAVSGAAITDNDRPAVYAVDDNTFSLAASATATGTHTLIGYVSRWVSTGVVIVEFDAALAKAATHA